VGGGFSCFGLLFFVWGGGVFFVFFVGFVLRSNWLSNAFSIRTSLSGLERTAFPPPFY